MNRGGEAVIVRIAGAVEEARSDPERNIDLVANEQAAVSVEGERVPIVDRALAVGGHNHRRSEQFGQFEQLGGGAASRHTAAGVNGRELGSGERLRRLLDEDFIRSRTFALGPERDECDVAFGEEGVRRDLDLDRTRTTGVERIERASENARNLARCHGAFALFGYRPDHFELVRNFVEESATDADHVRLDLPGDAEDRGVGRVGGRKRGGGIQQARTRHDQTCTDLSGGTRITIGHVGRGLLMASVDDLDCRLLFIENAEKPVELHARQTENGVDTGPLEHLDECSPASHSACRIGCDIGIDRGSDTTHRRYS